jgi:hypothetical protein
VARRQLVGRRPPQPVAACATSGPTEKKAPSDCVASCAAFGADGALSVLCFSRAPRSVRTSGWILYMPAAAQKMRRPRQLHALQWTWRCIPPGQARRRLFLLLLLLTKPPGTPTTQYTRTCRDCAGSSVGTSVN